METPIVFVHGTTVDGSCWDKTIEHLSDEGFENLYAITFENVVGETHERMSEQLDEFIINVREECGVETVSVVGHSLGATGVRYWMEDNDRYEWVDTVIYMAGAMHGTYACRYAPFFSDDVTEPCETIGVDEMKSEGNVLAGINEKYDECPEEPAHYTIRALFDKYYVLNPASPRLSGAVENRAIPTTHRGLLRHSGTQRLLVEWLSESSKNKRSA